MARRKRESTRSRVLGRALQVCRLPSGASSMATGTVKWFDDKKGYGFIAGDGGEEIFVHRSSIAGVGPKTLAEGAKVEFEMGRGPEGAPGEKRSGRPGVVGIQPSADSNHEPGSVP